MYKGYKELKVWQLGIELVDNIYQVSGKFPKEELFGLTRQIRRAALSIPSNIAEGWSRNSPKSFIQFLNIAQGSLGEIETQLLIAERLSLTKGPVDPKIYSLMDELGKMINSLITSIKKKENARHYSPGPTPSNH